MLKWMFFFFESYDSQRESFCNFRFSWANVPSVDSCEWDSDGFYFAWLSMCHNNLLFVRVAVYCEGNKIVPWFFSCRFSRDILIGLIEVRCRCFFFWQLQFKAKWTPKWLWITKHQQITWRQPLCWVRRHGNEPEIRQQHHHRHANGVQSKAMDLLGRHPQKHPRKHPMEMGPFTVTVKAMALLIPSPAVVMLLNMS